MWYSFLINYTSLELFEWIFPNSKPWTLSLNTKIWEMDLHSVLFLASKFLGDDQFSAQNLIQVNDHLFITKALLFFLFFPYPILGKHFHWICKQTTRPITSFSLLPFINILIVVFSIWELHLIITLQLLLCWESSVISIPQSGMWEWLTKSNDGGIVSLLSMVLQWAQRLSTKCLIAGAPQMENGVRVLLDSQISHSFINSSMVSSLSTSNS